jgi:hypothetical protein
MAKKTGMAIKKKKIFVQYNSRYEREYSCFLQLDHETTRNRNMNSCKHALKIESDKTLTMNEIAEKHFNYIEPQKRVR